MDSALHDIVPPVCGALHWEVFRNGEIVEVYDGSNLIVDSSKSILANLARGGSDSIIGFGVGTNGATPTKDDIALTDPYINGFTHVANTGDIAVFHFHLDGFEANGKVIRELGLLSSSGKLFARKVRANPLPKNADIRLVGYWTIRFTN